MRIHYLLKQFNFFRLFNEERNIYNKAYQDDRYVLVSILIWMLLIPLILLELLGVVLVFEWIRTKVLKTRCLNAYEVAELRKVYDNSIDYSQISIREDSGMASFGAKYAGKNHLGFVLFNTINFSRELDHENNSADIAWLVHECAHVLQYKFIGVAYVFEALRAQRYGGYLYGGVNQLKMDCKLMEFNLEQQAEIARHFYFAQKEKKMERSVFVPFIEQMKRGEF